MGITSATKSAATSRMSTWVWISIPLLIVVAILSPQKIGLFLYKAKPGHVRRRFSGTGSIARHSPTRARMRSTVMMPSAMIRRAIIMAACVLAMAIGL